MALHKDFPESPYAILDPAVRWFPADEALRETSMEKLMPPLVSQLRRKVKEWRDSGYAGATATSMSLLNWWFNTPHILSQVDGAALLDRLTHHAHIVELTGESFRFRQRMQEKDV